MAVNTLRLGRRCWSSAQRCYSNHLHTVVSVWTAEIIESKVPVELRVEEVGDFLLQVWLSMFCLSALARAGARFAGRRDTAASLFYSWNPGTDVSLWWYFQVSQCQQCRLGSRRWEIVCIVHVVPMVVFEWHGGTVVEMSYTQSLRFGLIMAALRRRCGHYIFVLFLSIYLPSFFSSPILSRRKLDVCHTSTHGVVLVRI